MSIDNKTDKEKGLHYHNVDDKPKNFDQKIYMFPESYNQLRMELHNHWPDLWSRVSWAMAFAANIFVEKMNDELGLAVILDSAKVDAICTEYLQTLRTKRGLQ